MRRIGEVAMGAVPCDPLVGDGAIAIPTGGMLPQGADAVVMAEDTIEAGAWIEVRRAVQRGENLVSAGEDVKAGAIVVRRGDLIGCGVQGVLSTLGITEFEVCAPSIGVISTGDEILPASTAKLPPGFVRDANSHIVTSVLKQYGFGAKFLGIVRDDREVLQESVTAALKDCDVLLLSGGSSVGTRDHATAVMESMGDPGLLVRGINMIPGKPTLIAGARDSHKLVVGLPGHPLSCLVTSLFVLLPLLLEMIGAADAQIGKHLVMPLAEDVLGRTGPEEFIPMRIVGDAVTPIAAKSGYVSTMNGCDGFIRLPQETETLRRGQEARIWIW